MSKRLFIGNLEYSTTNEDLKELFPGESSVTYIKEIRTLEGKLKSFGFVEMESADDGERAIRELDGNDHDGRNLKVNEARPRE